MSRRPWMALWIGDFLADTMHLSDALTGNYVLLICHYWQHGGLPDDPEQLARICKMSREQWGKRSPVLEAFFQDGWKHKRIEDELAKAAAYSEIQRARANERWQESDADGIATALPARASSPSPSPSPSLSKTTTESVAPSCGRAATRTAADDDFQKFWKAYPTRGSAANPKKPARDKFQRAVKAGADPQVITLAAKRYAQLETAAGRAGTEKIAQALTWLNQQRWNDYPPEAALNGTGPPPGAPSHEELQRKYGVH